MSGDQVKDKTAPTGAPLTAHAAEARQARKGDDAAAAVSSDAAPPSPRHLWQVPTIVLSLMLIGWGLYVAARPQPSHDIEAAVAQVESHLSEGQLESAANHIRTQVEPYLATAKPAVQARFHAAVADYQFLSGQASGLGRNASDQIITRYDQSRQLGLAMSAPRLERWAEALLALGKLSAARDRLVELDRLGKNESGELSEDELAAIAAVRNRVFRKVVEAALAHREQSFDELMTLLAEYRLHPNVLPEDEIWAIARQTELRLMHGSTQSALDMLFIEMRRLESRERIDAAGTGLLATRIGELYTLLGRCYFESGDYTKADTHLQRALGLFAGPEAEHADALALLGQIAMATGNPDGALGYFQGVVADFITTRGYLPSLLGRAEVNSMLGSHESSMADYRAVRDELAKSRPRHDVTPQRVAESLCDRHDAALAQGNLERALDCAELAESLFAAELVPPSVLLRLATINRQLADDLIAGGLPGNDTTTAHVRAPIDPAVRHEANVRYERAGHSFLRYAGADLSLHAKGGPDAATSIWLAADCFDEGGRQDLAIQYFVKYLDVQPYEDPRRAQTLFRIAQAHQAQLDFEKAIIIYEQLVSTQSRTEFAAQSYVPLARCYVAVNRVGDARQMLQQVLSGNRLLLPDAADYRAALVELGRIEHRAQEYAVAIGILTEFLQRYAADPATPEVRYMLGDCYRSSAQAIRRRVEEDASILPAEVGRLNELSVDHLHRAEELFAQVGEAQRDGKPAFEQEMIRRAALYRADCAFELQQFDRAVTLYDQASRDYSGHQSSMYALIQIVNCYNAMGDQERAASAHHRALVRLRQLPDDAFGAPDGLMDRIAWERWLEENPVVPPSRTAAAPSSG